MQILFGRNAAAQQTGAAQIRVAFDDRGFQPDLCSADRSGITARPRANYCDIKNVCHVLPLSLRRVGLRKISAQQKQTADEMSTVRFVLQRVTMHEIAEKSGSGIKAR